MKHSINLLLLFWDELTFTFHLKHSINFLKYFKTNLLLLFLTKLKWTYSYYSEMNLLLLFIWNILWTYSYYSWQSWNELTFTFSLKHSINFTFTFHMKHSINFLKYFKTNLLLLFLTKLKWTYSYFSYETFYKLSEVLWDELTLTILRWTYFYFLSETFYKLYSYYSWRSWNELTLTFHMKHSMNFLKYSETNSLSLSWYNNSIYTHKTTLG